MANSVYQINKGINRSIEFRGLKAQYIWYLGGGVVVLLIVFAVMYIVGITPLLCIGIVLIAGAALLTNIYKLSNRYGEHGMMKVLAKRKIPNVVKTSSRKVFFQKKPDSETHYLSN